MREVFGTLHQEPGARYQLLRTDKNGTQYYLELCDCSACRGTGYLPQFKYHCDGICFYCNGTGTSKDNIKVYTEEYGKKLTERRAKKAQEKAEDLEKNRIFYDAEASEKSLRTCMSRHDRECSTCPHKCYCSLLSEAVTHFNALPEKNEFQISITSIDTTPVPEIVTLEGEPCKCSKWFIDFYGVSKRCITKPNGEKVYTSAKTSRGLAKHGLKLY